MVDSYAIVETALLTEELFLQLKSEGIEQTSFQSIRRSLDGSQCVLKWDGDRPDSMDELTVVLEGSLGDIKAHLEANSEEWDEE